MQVMVVIMIERISFIIIFLFTQLYGILNIVGSIGNYNITSVLSVARDHSFWFCKRPACGFGDRSAERIY